MFWGTHHMQQPQAAILARPVASAPQKHLQPPPSPTGLSALEFFLFEISVLLASQPAIWPPFPISSCRCRCRRCPADTPVFECLKSALFGAGALSLR